MISRENVDVGDYIIFKYCTHDSHKKARRKVKGFDGAGRPYVGYAGYSDFIVFWHEIIEVEKAP